jgi:hypothetical protein
MEIIQHDIDTQLAPTSGHTGSLSLRQDSPAAIMLQALQHGTSIEQIEKIMDLQERWERNEAAKQYSAAFAAFKAEAVVIIKGRKVTDGPLKGRSYAELHDIVDAVTPALSKHGLSAYWKVSRDEPSWIEVTCSIKHVGGHSESVSMGGPPDAGGAKNSIQARASTITYLERYTLKAIAGMAEVDDDTDGNPPGNDSHLADWLASIDAAQTEQELKAIRREAGASFTKRKDVPGYAKFAAAATAREKALKSA